MFNWNESKPFNCIFDNCSAVFPNNSALNVHITLVHEEKKKYTCDVCNVGFTRKEYLTKHDCGHFQSKRPRIIFDVWFS